MTYRSDTNSRSGYWELTYITSNHKSPNSYSKAFVSLNNLALSCVLILSNFDPYLIAFG